MVFLPEPRFPLSTAPKVVRDSYNSTQHARHESTRLLTTSFGKRQKPAHAHSRVFPPRSASASRAKSALPPFLPLRIHPPLRNKGLARAPDDIPPAHALSCAPSCRQSRPICPMTPRNSPLLPGLGAWGDGFPTTTLTLLLVSLYRSCALRPFVQCCRASNKMFLRRKRGRRRCIPHQKIYCHCSRKNLRFRPLQRFVSTFSRTSCLLTPSTMRTTAAVVTLWSSTRRTFMAASWRPTPTLLTLMVRASRRWP